LLALSVSVFAGFLVTRGLGEGTRHLIGSWRSPFWVSIRVAAGGALIGGAAGIGAGYALAKSRVPGRDLVEAVGSIPIILPPTVLGYYLISVFGNTTSGDILRALLGGPLLFNTRGVVIVAAVAAFPYCMRAARAAIAGVDPKLEQAARAMGMSEAAVALRVTLPAARRGCIVGLTLGAARAWGEYGATLMVGGAITGNTRTMPIAVTQAQGTVELQPMLRTMVVVAVGVMLALAVLEHRDRGSARA